MRDKSELLRARVETLYRMIFPFGGYILRNKPNKVITINQRRVSNDPSARIATDAFGPVPSSMSLRWYHLSHQKSIQKRLISGSLAGISRESRSNLASVRLKEIEKVLSSREHILISEHQPVFLHRRHVARLCRVVGTQALYRARRASRPAPTRPGPAVWKAAAAAAVEALVAPSEPEPEPDEEAPPASPEPELDAAPPPVPVAAEEEVSTPLFYKHVPIDETYKTNRFHPRWPTPSRRFRKRRHSWPRRRQWSRRTSLDIYC